MRLECVPRGKAETEAGRGRETEACRGGETEDETRVIRKNAEMAESERIESCRGDRGPDEAESEKSSGETEETWLLLDFVEEGRNRDVAE